MGLDQRRRQKKLAKQRARRKARAAAQKPSRQGGPSPSRMMATLEFDLASSAPAYECYVADEIFDREKGQGMGQVIVSRLSGGMVAAGIFLIDAFCLGVKDAFAFSVGPSRPTPRSSSWTQSHTRATTASSHTKITTWRAKSCAILTKQLARPNSLSARMACLSTYLARTIRKRAANRSLIHSIVASVLADTIMCSRHVAFRLVFRQR